MKISLNWLSRYVDLGGLEPERIALDLTMSTAETEGLERFGLGARDIVVGEVVACDRHPSADKLSLTRVAFGGAEAVPVVCGAPNVAKGQKIAFAPVGAALPGSLTIARAEIRGETSLGMICSERELGLSEEHGGILVLDPATRVGAPLWEAVPETSDWIIEIDNKSVTHRPDLWGHYGFARELAAIYGRPLKPYPAPEPEAGTGEPFPVEIVDPEGCPRYLALRLGGFRVERSPRWLRYLLEAVGQRSLSNAVDLSNFVMLDCGQPNHLFDAAKLRGGRIVVRRARPGEPLRTLDGVERSLGAEDLAICDGEGPVAVAGVMGGEATEVDASTQDALLEVAAFDPVRIRRSSQRLGLRSEASARFEKSLDPTLVLDAAWRFVDLARQLCPEVRVLAPTTDVGNWKRPGSVLVLHGKRVRAKLGAEVDDERIAGILGGLGFGVRSSESALEIEVPTWRATKDVTLEDDLVEEVGRMIGYGSIAERPPRMPVVPPHRDPERELRRRAQDTLAALGFFEACNYSFVADEILTALGEDGARYLEVLNPIAAGLVRLRREAVPSLLGNLAENLRHVDEVALFEVAKGYERETLDERFQPRERHWIGALWAARGREDDAWRDGAFYRAKGVLDELLGRLDASGARYLPLANGTGPCWAHPGRAARVVRGGVELGVVAEVHPRALRALGLEARVGAFQVDLRALLGARDAVRRYAAEPRFPGVRLDVAVACSRSRPSAEIADLVQAVAPELVRDLELFDVYEGSSVGEGRRSLAFHLVLQAPDRTLGEKDVAGFLERLAASLGAADAELRRD